MKVILELYLTFNIIHYKIQTPMKTDTVYYNIIQVVNIDSKIQKVFSLYGIIKCILTEVES